MNGLEKRTMCGFTVGFDLLLLNFTVMIGIGVVIMPMGCENAQDDEQNDNNHEDTIVNELSDSIEKFSD
jgi:hypothetical protein